MARSKRIPVDRRDFLKGAAGVVAGAASMSTAGLAGTHIDYAKLAQSMGVYAEGPIAEPKELGPALGRAIAVVKRGEPALVDVVTQPR